jgi:hypothetical protein
MPELNITPESTRDLAGNPPPQAAATGDNGSTSPKLSGAALWVAIFAMATWIAFSIVLIAKANVSETEWTRLAWVFGSIQAIAFAATGALFGTAVQQQNVNTAQQQATLATKDAEQHRDDAANGRALAVAMQAEAATQPAENTEGIRRAGAAGVPGRESADELRQRHAQLSRALFGDLA